MVQYPRIQDHKTDHIERVISYIYALRDLSHFVLAKLTNYLFRPGTVRSHFKNEIQL